jgi:hydroxyacylglutathione hydrolase
MKFLKSSMLMMLAVCGAVYAQTEPIQIKAFANAGVIPVNCYLLFDAASRDAALVDAGGSIEGLLAEMKKLNLNLKYIFITHVHPDHVDGIPAIRARHPEAKVCFAQEEYDDRERMARWREIFAPSVVEAWSKNPGLVKLMDYDYDQIGRPDIVLHDQQQLKVGGAKVTVLKTPGHTRGSATFSVDRALFPGDLILYHETGYMDCQLCSKDETVKSIRRLYGLFPDETVLYSGHGASSTIGFEKTGNKNVTADQVIWK